MHDAVKTARDAGKPVIPETIRKRIFLNLPEIHTLNTDLLVELEAKLQSWSVYNTLFVFHLICNLSRDQNPAVCDTIATRAPYLKVLRKVQDLSSS